MREIQSEDDSLLPGAAACAWAGGLALLLFAGLSPFVPIMAAALSAYLFFTMALITLSDLRHFVIPDVLSLPAIPAGLLANALVLHGGDWWAGLTQGFAGALIGGGAFHLLRLVYFRLRGIEGLGLGDVKLAAVAGAWLGPASLAPACLVASLAAVAGVILHAGLSGRGKLHARLHIPFGSFIAPTLFAFWMGYVLADVPFWMELLP